MADEYDRKIEEWENGKKPEEDLQSQNISDPDKGKFRFWYFEIINKSGDKRWKIDHRKFMQFLYSRGYRRFDLNEDFFFVKIKDRIIEKKTITEIQDFVIKYIYSINEDDLGEISREELLSILYRSNAIFFNDKKLSLIGVEKNLVFNSDTKDHCFIYYSNGFVKCSREGYELLLYKELTGHIYRKQVKNRKFFKKENTDDGNFRKFVFNISGKDEERFRSLQTMIGYLLHGYYETKLRAVNLTDSTISDNAEGRTGKTLLGRSLAQIKNLCEISGKDFDPTNKHKYSKVDIDTQIVFLNDLRKNFKFETLFNDISDAITVDRKNLQPFQIVAKMMISSNDTFRIEGASAQDRVIEFELSEHYSINWNPEMEFKQWFFRDWDEIEWLKFDNFMMQCVCLYLKEGIIIAPSINLDKRKQIQHTNRDFVEFMDEKISDLEIKREVDYDKKELHDEFLRKYPDYVTDRWLKNSSNFTKYLKTYASYSSELKGKIKERRSHGQSFIRFSDPLKEQQEKLF